MPAPTVVINVPIGWRVQRIDLKPRREQTA